MCSSPLKGQEHCFLDPLLDESAGFDQERHIHQVFHPAVCAAPWECISMEFLGKLLFTRNHLHSRALDAGKVQPVPALDGIHWLHHCVADSRIEMESRKDSPIHSCLDRVS